MMVLLKNLSFILQFTVPGIGICGVFQRQSGSHSQRVTIKNEKRLYRCIIKI